MDIFFLFGNTIKGDIMYYYINNFLLYSFIGFIYENIMKLIVSGKFVDNPFYGPIMPVYGFGICVMIVLIRFIFNRFKIPRFVKWVMVFLSSFFVLSILELLGGLITEAVLHKSYWDYSSLTFNYGKYISVEVSLIWGVLSLVFLYVFRPFTDKLVKKIPKWLSLVLLFLVGVDFVFSFVLKLF